MIRTPGAGWRCPTTILLPSGGPPPVNTPSPCQRRGLGQGHPGCPLTQTLSSGTDNELFSYKMISDNGQNDQIVIFVLYGLQINDFIYEWSLRCSQRLRERSLSPPPEVVHHKYEWYIAMIIANCYVTITTECPHTNATWTTTAGRSSQCTRRNHTSKWAKY